ncbi:hypothetical protein TcWFU_009331 [Taenia crassiceps]|uniref:Uncharacterized protein n=1 Tax=Taenia crassiceps TaxID=6207 RepID=A0ABR4QMW9_9CEST
MTMRTFQRHPPSSKETLNEVKESRGGSKELEHISDDEVDERRPTPERTQVLPFCAIILFIYVVYIFLLAAFIVASVIFIKTEDTQPGPMPTNITST